MRLRYLLLALGLLCAPLLLHAQGLQHKPRKSPLGMETYRKGDAYLKITYGRPSMRDDMDRKFGLSVPFDKIWRLGDDDATEMTITKPILFAGDTLRAGTYSLFAIPDTTAWTFVVNRQLGQWGTTKYDPAHNVLEKRIKVLRSPYVFTTFSIFLQPEKVGVNMYVIWDRTSLVIPIRFLQEEVGDYQSAFDGLLEKDQQRADSLRQVARAKALSDSLATTLQADSLQIAPQDTLSEEALPIQKPKRMPDRRPRIEEQPFDDRPIPGAEPIPDGEAIPAVPVPSQDAPTEQLTDSNDQAAARKAQEQGKKELEKARKQAAKEMEKVKKQADKALKKAQQEAAKALKQVQNPEEEGNTP